MGCGCGSKNNSPGGYVWTDANGVDHEYATEIEAKAARINAGGGGSVHPA